MPAPARASRPRAAWRLALHWLLLVLITLDLVTAPFHSHTHDVGADHYGPAAATAVSTTLPRSASGK